MKVSIITVSKNSKLTLQRTIESVINQTYKNIEYLVIDSNSSDGTADIIHKFYSHISKVVIEHDNGVFEAMNKGISLATGELIGILNSDDYFADNYVVEKIVHEVNESKSDIFYGDINIFNNKNVFIETWIPGKFLKNSFINGWHPPHPSLFVKKTVYDDIGHYDEDYEFSADFDFMLRAFEFNDFKIIYKSIIVVHYQLGGGSSKNIKNILKGNYNIYKSFNKNNIKLNVFRYFYLRLKPKLKRFIKYNLWKIYSQ